jgi:signal transduction histidine kinase
VREVAERAAAVAPGNPVRVETRGSIPRIQADAARIEQVLGNLLSNGAKYGSPGSEILVVVERRDDAVELAVINQGEGIPAEELPKLFRRFHRSRRATERKISGLGLGLFIAKGLVEAHGGRIWAESIPNQTTRFCFTLPVASGE